VDAACGLAAFHLSAMGVERLEDAVGGGEDMRIGAGQLQQLAVIARR